MLLRTSAWSLGVEVITKAQTPVVDVIQFKPNLNIIQSFNDFQGIVGEVTENLSVPGRGAFNIVKTFDIPEKPTSEGGQVLIDVHRVSIFWQIFQVFAGTDHLVSSGA